MVTILRGRRRGATVCALLVGAVAAAGCRGGSSKAAEPPTATAHPNVVFVLADDLSWNLINDRFTPNIMKLEQRGEKFSNYFVADSLCCPSRSTIFTGLFPHDTKVTTNVGATGGFKKFQSEHLDQRTFALSLQRVGYSTSMLGKYLNGYGDPMNAANAPVPPGWSDWHVSNSTGYAEFNFLLNDNGAVHRYTGTSNYGVDVVNRDAESFIEKSAGHPFMVEAATFAPHAPFTPAPRNASDFPGLQEPRDPSFNTANVNAPAWLAGRHALPPGQIRRIDTAYRRRAQAMESVDKLVGDLEARLKAEHLTDKTYIVFSSDNGYHLGQHRLARGKQTTFDTDIRVPLIVAGPGVPAGKVVSQVAQNVDLAPTLLALSGARATGPMDGHSLVPLLHPAASGAPAWRTVALVEHHGANDDPADPDFEGGGSNPTTYEAVRVVARHVAGFDGPVNAVYVEYQDRHHELEYYDVPKDPYERVNTEGQLTAGQKAELHKMLTALVNCHDAAACWTAARPE